MSNYEVKVKKIKALKRFKRFEVLNRFLCLASVVPFLYMNACLGQGRKVPVVSKVGSVAFGGTIMAAALIDKKEKKTKKELGKLLKENRVNLG